MSEAYIYDALRTPRGKGEKGGALYQVKPIDLLGQTLQALHDRNNSSLDHINDFLLGCVSPVGDQGANLARAALLQLGWRTQAGGLQLNRFCASGLEAVNLAALKIRAGGDRLVVAGGVESMSRVPMHADGGPLIYDPEVINTVDYLPPGVAADLIATQKRFERTELDSFALQSHQRAAKAWEEGRFKGSIIPIFDRNGLPILEKDEGLQPESDLETLGALPPAYLDSGGMGFDQMALHHYPSLEGIDHQHTAATSSGFADGAGLILLGDQAVSETIQKKARARIRCMANVSVEPTAMLGGGPPAARLALERAGMEARDIDLWECNEVFAAVALDFIETFKLDHDRFNVNGGALAMGHPLGATGAMLLGTLLDELERQDLETGLLALPVGGGMGIATIIQRV